MNCVTIVRAADIITNEMPIPGMKQNIILPCLVPPMVLHQDLLNTFILWHLCLKYIDFSSTLYG